MAIRERIFLAGVLCRLPEKVQNFRLYKAMMVHQWAQNWFGAWRGGLLLEALFEARLEDVPPFCIAIDQQGAEYLPHIYGAANRLVTD